MPKKYESYKLNELKQKAKLRNIKGGYKMNKSQLIENLRNKNKKQNGGSGIIKNIAQRQIGQQNKLKKLQKQIDDHIGYINNELSKIDSDVTYFPKEIYNQNGNVNIELVREQIETMYEEARTNLTRERRSLRPQGYIHNQQGMYPFWIATAKASYLLKELHRNINYARNNLNENYNESSSNSNNSNENNLN
jgi:hypothetical protein